MTRIFSIVNQKGGVGKTTTAVNLATALAAIKKKVLLIDLDPQGNASTGLGINKAERRYTSYQVLLENVPAEQAVIETRIPNLSLIPSTVDLAGAELELAPLEQREQRLKQQIASLGTAFDYVLIDCPPSLGLLTVNALVACQYLIVPLQCEFYALEGLGHLLKTIERVKKKLNPTLTIHGVLLTMYDRRNKLSSQIEADVREFLGTQVYHTTIPRNVRISEAPSHGKPALLYDFNCSGSQAYLHLAKEVVKRERQLMKEAA